MVSKFAISQNLTPLVHVDQFIRILYQKDRYRKWDKNITFELNGKPVLLTLELTRLP